MPKAYEEMRDEFRRQGMSLDAAQAKARESTTQSIQKPR